MSRRGRSRANKLHAQKGEDARLGKLEKLKIQSSKYMDNDAETVDITPPGEEDQMGDIAEDEKLGEDADRGPLVQRNEEDLKMKAFDVVLEVLKNEKIANLVVVNMKPKTDWVGTMFVGTGLSTPHLRATGSRVKSRLKMSGNSVIFKSQEGWIIVKTPDIVVQLFTERERMSWNLERLWCLKASQEDQFLRPEAAQFEENKEDWEDLDYTN